MLCGRGLNITEQTVLEGHRDWEPVCSGAYSVGNETVMMGKVVSTTLVLGPANGHSSITISTYICILHVRSAHKLAGYQGCWFIEGCIKES